jgi:5-bromo-4-chloroindolyl phosphate hydrolysis protein
MGKHGLTKQGVETINDNLERAKDLLKTAAEIILNASDWSPEVQEIHEYIENSADDVDDILSAWRRL